jgi:hypothetical protein
MPVHDWSKVEPNLFHDFHQTWTIAIRNALNAGILPKDYSALADQRSGGMIPDVLTVERPANGKHGKDPTRGGNVLVGRPKTRFAFQATKSLLAESANRILIHHPLGEIVCVIEIVSPGNKNGKAAFDKFVDKSVRLLQNGIHLVVVDLFPPTTRDPQGIHKAIWDQIEDNEFNLPSKQNLTLASYVAPDPLAELNTTAYLEFIGVGESLTDMPAFLDHDHYVYVPLETTYQSSWLSCPERMREYVLASSIDLT